jgi:hypothetical protein
VLFGSVVLRPQRNQSSAELNFFRIRLSGIVGVTDQALN